MQDQSVNQYSKVLDVCCGSKMFWFEKNHSSAIYCDIRKESYVLCDERPLNISPDILSDFRNLPFKNNTFKAVIFDPPHLDNLGTNSWMAKKYGVLNRTWRDDIKEGFRECFRVLESNGILIFKWNQVQIKTSEILRLTDRQPLIGHISGKRSNTHWITFLK